MNQENQYSTILNLVENKNFIKIKHLLTRILPAEVVEIIRHIENYNDKITVFRLLSKEYSADVFSEFNTEEQENILSQLNEYEIKNLIHEMSPDDRTALFENIDEDIKTNLFSIMQKEDLEETKELLAYPEYSVGRVMTTDFLDIKPYFTIEKTLDYIKEHGRDSEIFEVIYVVDNDNVLKGYVLLSELIFAKMYSRVHDITHQEVVSISVFADQEEAVFISKKYDLLYIPVVDGNGKLIGIVTVDDIMDIAEEEDTEDFHKLGAISSIDDDENIKQAPVFKLYKKRIFWLFILVFVNVISGTIIGMFEGTINKYIALIFFLPLLIDSAGNAGAQASTLIIRSLATGNVKIADWFFMFLKEALVSITLGLTMSLAVSLIAFWRGGIKISIVVSIAMVLVVTIGSLIGMSLPFLLSKLKIDPATSSAPLVASICDISGTAIYLALATFILKI